MGDGITTDVDAPVDIAVLDNDHDPDGDPLNIAEVSPPARGSVSPIGTAPGIVKGLTSGGLRYHPTSGFTGTETFTYTAGDGVGGFTTATVTVTVEISNDPDDPDDPSTTPTDDNQAPVATADTVTGAVGVPEIIQVLANDHDPDGNLLRVVRASVPTSGAVVINADNTLTYTSAPDSIGPITFSYTVADDQGGTATAVVTVNLTNVFDPPTGRKVINPENLPELEWRMVWINAGNVLANPVRVTDTLPDGTSFIPGSLTCEARGESRVDRCLYEVETDQIVYEGVVGPDPGAATETEALHEVVLTFRVLTPLGFFGPVANQAEANWDGNGNGVLDDELASGQVAVRTDDPTTLVAGDPTLTTLPALPGACLFQFRSVSAADQSPDYEDVGDPAEGGATRQVSADIAGLTTPQAGQVVAGDAVAVAAIQGAGPISTVSAPVRVTVANAVQPTQPDIVESENLKSERVPAEQEHVIVTSSGVLLAIPADALPQAEEVVIEPIDPIDIPGALPGALVAGLWQVSIGSGLDQFSTAATLRAPYADADQDGRVDATNPVIAEPMLTLWRYDDGQASWVLLPTAVVISEANVIVVQTAQAGLFGVFQAADGQVGGLGTVADDVQLALAQGEAAGELINPGWQDIDLAVASPFVAAWNTALVPDGDYELRAICAADASVVASFQTSSGQTSSGQTSSGQTSSGQSVEGGSSACFIATAAYGSPLQAQVQVLRDFRDGYLMTHAIGRWAIAHYYRLSPPLATAMRQHNGLRTTVRLGLTPVVWGTSWLMRGAPGAGLILLAGLVTGWYLVRRRAQYVGR